MVDPGEEDADPTTQAERTERTRRRERRALRSAPGRRRPPQPDRDAARDDLVHLHLPLVEHCARRFRNRGEPLEDLVQVGTIGLLKAIDRFDTERGVEFSTYATPTVLGEIKRYFRDKGWAIRVPRRLQELRMQINGVSAELTQTLGRSPTPRELAEADRLLGGGDPRGPGVGQRLRDALPRPGRERRGRAGVDPRLDRRRRREPGARRGPGVAQAPPRPARPAGEADPPAAVLQEHDPVADRRGDRGLPDARVAAADPDARAAADLARGDGTGQGASRSRAPRGCAGAAGTPASRPTPRPGRRPPPSCRRRRSSRR